MCSNKWKEKTRNLTLHITSRYVNIHSEQVLWDSTYRHTTMKNIRIHRNLCQKNNLKFLTFFSLIEEKNGNTIYLLWTCAYTQRRKLFWVLYVWKIFIDDNQKKKALRVHDQGDQQMLLTRIYEDCLKALLRGDRKAKKIKRRYCFSYTNLSSFTDSLIWLSPFIPALASHTVPEVDFPPAVTSGKDRAIIGIRQWSDRWFILMREEGEQKEVNNVTQKFFKLLFIYWQISYFAFLECKENAFKFSI